MGRLIDADVLLNKIKEYSELVYEHDATSEDDVVHCQRINKDDKALVYTMQGLLESVELINDQPTAYDVDRVIKRISNDKEHTVYGCINKYEAIEIVKEGAVKDEPMSQNGL